MVNDYVRSVLSHPAFAWLDGEVVLDWTDPHSFSKTIGVVMKKAKRPLSFQYCVFDKVEEGVRYDERQPLAAGGRQMGFVLRVVPQSPVPDFDTFQRLENDCIEQGFEGMMLRDALGTYKFGRSTWRERDLIKVKRFVDAEGIVVDWKPLGGDPEAVGSLVLEIVNGDFAGRFVDVGSGFSESERVWLRACIDKLILDKAQVVFKYFPHGSEHAPRHAVFKGLRGRE